MGPNGSGKSTLSNTIMGHPNYKVTKGQIIFNEEDITKLTSDQRARKGLFLAFQYPSEVSGVTLSNFLRTVHNSLNGHKEDSKSFKEFQNLLKQKMELLKMDESFARRYLNEGFSGGEKKRSEILQLAMLNPKIALLDETDSGLDIDSLKIVANGIKDIAGPNMGILLITHYQRILQYIKPKFVHVMSNGKIVKSGDHKLAEELERNGYDSLLKEVNGNAS